MNESEQNKKEFYNKLNIKELEVYAERGDAEAQFTLGYRYRYGKKAETGLCKTRLSVLH